MDIRYDGSSFVAQGFIGDVRGFWSEVQRSMRSGFEYTVLAKFFEDRSGTAFLKPRHFLGVRLAVRTMSWISSSDTLS